MESSRAGKDWLMTAAASPLLWGAAATTAAYAAIPYLPAYRALAERYLCSHWIEYVTAACFFVALAMLTRRLTAVRGERAALRIAEALDSGDATEAAGRAERLERLIGNLSSPQRNSRFAQRVKDACWYVRARHSGQGLDEHLGHLSEQAADRLHESYGLVRTITWAIPILGFLGTVIGITLAIANITPAQLETSLTEVTGGLAVAFDTTALSLVLSLVLVFATFLVERTEQQILNQVDDLAAARLIPMFATAEAPGGALGQAEARAAREIIDSTQSLVTRQAKLWQESLEEQRRRWIATLETQQQELSDLLRQKTTALLENHEGQLQEVRSHFLEAVSEGGDSLRSGLAMLQESQHEQVDRFLSALSKQTTAWTEALRASTEAGRSQMSELERQGETLLQIVAHEKDLARLQDRLSENLEALRATGAFEETIHSLSAAIHLLTARAGGSSLRAA